MAVREFLAGHHLSPGDVFTAALMIAPARDRRLRDPHGAVRGARGPPHRDRPRPRAASRDERDRALAAEIATGVQRWRAALDHLIAQVSTRPLERLDPEIVDILRLSAYQLLHLTRVPASAVVDDGVNLAGRAGKRSARRLRERGAARPVAPAPTRCRCRRGPATPADRDAALAYLSVTLSHPRWLAARWLERYGLDAAERGCAFDNEPAPLTLRANRLRADARRAGRRDSRDEDVETPPTRFAPDGLVVERGIAARRGRGRARVVRRAGRSVAARAAARRPGSRPRACSTRARRRAARRRRWPPPCGDAGCSSPATARARRMDLLRRTVAREPAPRNVRLVQADVRAPLPFTRPFDCVLVDAPCSGLGTLRRDPDIRWRRREDDLPALAAAQLVMLQRAADAVAPGGRLVYATCSSEPEENEGGRRRVPGDDAGFRRRSTRAWRRRDLPAGARRRARAPAHVPTSARPRGLLRRGVRPPRPGRRLVVPISRVPWPSGRASGARASSSCSAARSRRPTCSSPAAAMRLALRAREVQVPNLTNRTANEAAALTGDLGLTLKVDDAGGPIRRSPPAACVAQEPAAGSIARRQRSIRIWLSAGQHAPDGAAARRRDRAHRAARAVAGRPGASRPSRKSDRRTTRPTSSSRRSRRPRAPARRSRCSSTAPSAARPT